MIEIAQVTKDLTACLKKVIEGIYPIGITDEGVALPFVIYTKTGYTEYNVTKDGRPGCTVMFTISAVSKGYLEGIEIIDGIREKLRKMTGDYKYKVTVDGVSEEGFDDGFSQTLNISIDVNYY